MIVESIKFASPEPHVVGLLHLLSIFFRVNYFIDFWARNDENTEAFELQSAV